MGSTSVSGIVQIHLATELIEQGISRLNEEEPPSEVAQKLPPNFRYPSVELKEKALAVNLRKMIANYHMEFGKLDVDLVTPVRIAALEIEHEKLASNRRQMRNRMAQEAVGNFNVGGGFYEWRKFAGDYRPVVAIQVTPEIGMTGDSVLMAILMRSMGATAPRKLKFKGDFERMELYMDGILIEPYHPGRIPQVTSYDAGMVSMHDVAYFGRYEYPPEVFNPIAEVELVIWEEGSSKPIRKTLKKAMQEQIWNDFRPYFDFIYEE
jgi:hypothetical protein